MARKKQLEVPEATALYGVSAVADILNVDRTMAAKVINSGLAGISFVMDGGDSTQRAASRKYVLTGEVQKLARRPFLEPYDRIGVNALVVNVGPAERVLHDARRDWIGWHGELPPDVNIRGVQGDWKIADPDALAGWLLVPVLASFVVGPLSVITGGERVGGGRSWLNVEPAPVKLREGFEGKRLPVRPGPVLYRLPALDQVEPVVEPVG